MPITRIKLYENWPAITEEVRKKAQVALGRAEEAALAEITGIWPHGGMHLEGVHPTVDGFASGVSAAHDKKQQKQAGPEPGSDYLRALSACLEGRGYTVAMPAPANAVAQR